MLRKRQKKYHKELNVEDFESLLQESSFEDLIVEKESMKSELSILMLRDKILNHLTKKEQKLYKMRYMEKQDVSSIAKTLQISYTAVTTRLQRLKVKIMNLIKKMSKDEIQALISSYDEVAPINADFGELEENPEVYLLTI